MSIDTSLWLTENSYSCVMLLVLNILDYIGIYIGYLQMALVVF